MYVNMRCRCRRPADRPVRVDRRGRAPPGPLHHQAQDLRPRLERDLHPRSAERCQVLRAIRSAHFRPIFEYSP